MPHVFLSNPSRTAHVRDGADLPENRLTATSKKNGVIVPSPEKKMNCQSSESTVPSRPARIAIKDSEGRQRTLDANMNQYQCVFAGASGTGVSEPPLLLLGLGPEPAQLVAALNHAHGGDWACDTGRVVFWLEYPYFLDQLPENTTALQKVKPLQAAEPLQDTAFLQEKETTKQGAHKVPTLPAFWQRIEPNDMPLFLKTISPRPTVWMYKPGLRLFADFWGPVLGWVEAMQLDCSIDTTHIADNADLEPNSARAAGIPRGTSMGAPVVLLPGDEHSLLTRELEQAFMDEGFTPVRLPVSEPEASQALRAFLRHERPALFVSVNLQGLDPDGLNFHLLKACGVPVACWMVDNPWHVLSVLRLAWWKALPLFVTDATFVKPLRQHGALQVTALPLAAWYTPQQVTESRATQPATGSTGAIERTTGPTTGSSFVHEPTTSLLFVGRSAFPHKQSFFAGVRVPAPLMQQAEALLRAAPNAPEHPVPHAGWWAHHVALGIDAKGLWPGKACRQVGFGAEQSSLLQRRLFLEAACPLGLTVYGDAAWRELLPAGVVLREPVDYYTTLPGLYQAYPYTLNVTSLLLPGGLTQRHFDVWMAGGFLLTNHTSGLELFPRELVEPITLGHPAQIGERVRRLHTDATLRTELSVAWQACLAAGHTYRHRVRALIEHLGLC